MHWILFEADGRERLAAIVARPALHFLPRLAAERLLPRLPDDDVHEAVCDWMTELGADVVRRRRVILDEIERLARKGGDPAVFSLMPKAFSLELRSMRYDEIAPAMLDCRVGVLPLDEVERLFALWPQALAILKRAERGVALARDIAQHWCHPPPWPGGGSTDDWRQVVRKCAGQMISDVVALADKRPGIVLWAHRTVEEAGLAVAAPPVDSETSDLFPDPLRALETSKTTASAPGRPDARTAEHRKASELAQADAHEGAGELLRLAEEGMLADCSPEQQLQGLVEMVAQTTERPAAWVEALAGQSAYPAWVASFVDAALALGEESQSVWNSLLARAKYDDVVVWAGIRHGGVPERVDKRIVERLHVVEGLPGGNDWKNVSEAWKLRLLRCGSEKVEMAAAWWMWWAGGLTGASRRLLSAWVDVIARSDDRLLLGAVFRGPSPVARRVARAWFLVPRPDAPAMDDGGDPADMEEIRERVQQALDFPKVGDDMLDMAASVLDHATKAKLIQDMPAETTHRAFLSVVGQDAELYRVLLGRRDVSRVHLLPFRNGGALERGVGFALCALDAGYPASAIADESEPRQDAFFPQARRPRAGGWLRPWRASGTASGKRWRRGKNTRTRMSATSPGRCWSETSSRHPRNVRAMRLSIAFGPALLLEPTRPRPAIARLRRRRPWPYADGEAADQDDGGPVSTPDRPAMIATAFAVALNAAAAATPADAPRAQAAVQLSTRHLEALRPRNIGPAVMSGRIVDLAVVESDPIKFYVASATGGVFKTADNGITLSPVFEHEGTHSVGAIAVHPVDTALVWVGTGERANRQSSSWGDGVYKSTDGGASWANMGLGDSRHIGRIALHPGDPRTVYVAAMGRLWGPNEERGLYKSEDGGETWTRVLHVDEDTGAVDVALDPGDPSIVYAATYQRRRRAWGFHGGGPGSALYKSADAGATWTKLTGPGANRGLPESDIGRIGISVYRSDPRIVYASVEQGYRYNASTAYGERRAGIYRSEDRGESWERMSDWNPRPMYASQILVDPSDDQRVYMVNSYSFSDDGGRTFTVPRQSLHGDDRLVWVNPADSRHVMKADDGGLGISYDRGLSWLYISDLPVSQYYRVAVDMAVPYNVYGGLQDNGSWMGPSETYRSAGILNGDWMRLGGGDGFLNLPDTTNNAIVYTESQYLGLSRFDLRTGERTAIRPGDPRGHIAARRNWTTWKDVGPPEEQRLGNAMAPANWDGPFVISPHDASTLYAGTNVLWKTTDRGDSWTPLGDLTTGVDRRALPIMGQAPGELVPSLDDGIPYYPTISAVAESPLAEGLLYAGTDDGRLHVSRDGGTSWTDVAGAFPGLPEGAWVAGLEPSRHEEARVYAVWNNYRSDDYSNYLYRSDDYGESWTSVAGDLPPERVLRTVREDPRNPSVLFLGAEIGLYYTMDGGRAWTELRGGMPTQAFNDLVVHPRDNDLVLGTHGRGVWILDQINALQELSHEIMARPAHLFSVEPAVQVRRSGRGVHAGDVHFAGENPPNGAVLDYWLAQPAEEGEVELVVESSDGEQVAALDGTGLQGMNRVVWNLRHEMTQAPAPGGGALVVAPSRQEGPRGPLVVPGVYVARLEAAGTVSVQEVEVRPDPRSRASAEVRAAWTETLLELARARLRAEGGSVSASSAQLEDMEREFDELASRIGRLASEVAGVVAPLTQTQRSRREYYAEMLRTLETELAEAMRN